METIIGAGAGAGEAAASGDHIKDISQMEFAQEVVQASMRIPVIVDFWAPWCGPCKQLGPALEKAVAAARGAVRLVKINIDENQELAAQLQIQSIPTVYAFFQGQPVDAFQGALPDSQIKTFIERLAKQSGAATSDPVSQAVEQAQKALIEGRLAEASALFGRVLQHEPENRDALAGIIACDLGNGDLPVAQAKLEGLTAEVRDSKEFESIRAQIEMAEKAAKAGPLDELRARVAQAPNDYQAHFDLAIALQAAGAREEAVDALLDIIRRNRAWNDEAARKQLVEFFDAWGPTDPLTVESRRRLSSVLFS